MYVRDRMLSALPQIKDQTIIDLLETEIPELELITNLVWDTKMLMLIPYANLEWVERWENSLKILPQTLDLEERKRYLLAIISSKIKISSESLEDITKTFTGINNRVTVENSAVTIRFLGKMPEAEFKRFDNYIREVIPAHLGILKIVDAPMRQSMYLGACSSYNYSKIFFNEIKGGKK